MDLEQVAQVVFEVILVTDKVTIVGEIYIIVENPIKAVVDVS